MKLCEIKKIIEVRKENKNEDLDYLLIKRNRKELEYIQDCVLMIKTFSTSISRATK